METTRDIVIKVKEYIREHDLKIQNNEPAKAYIRFHLMRYLRLKTYLTYREIGELFDRDHATAHGGGKRYLELCDDSYFIEVTKDVSNKFPMYE